MLTAFFWKTLGVNEFFFAQFTTTIITITTFAPIVTIFQNA